MNREQMWLLEEKYGGEKTEGFFADCARLKAGEPLAYLIGSIPFRSAFITLDSRPLIPRTETEFWVGEIIPEIAARELPVRVLDLCAGSGCIGVSVLLEVPMSRVDFAEIDPTHHATIQKNIVVNKISSERTKIFGGNLFENAAGTYDFILSNPPYIDITLDRTEASVAVHEPSLALYGGEQGLVFIEKIITESPKYLSVHGSIVIEHEPEQTEDIHRLAISNGYAYVTSPDQYAIERYTVLTRKAS